MDTVVDRLALPRHELAFPWKAISLPEAVREQRLVAHSLPSVTSLRTACLILAWIVGVHSAAVRIAADRYAPYLLEAALDLET